MWMSFPRWMYIVSSVAKNFQLKLTEGSYVQPVWYYKVQSFLILSFNSQLDQHIEEVCPKTKMVCDFEVIGCTHRVSLSANLFALDRKSVV